MKYVKKVAYEAGNDTFTVTLAGEGVEGEQVVAMLSAIEGLGFDPKVVKNLKKSLEKPKEALWPEELPEPIRAALSRAHLEKKPILLDFYASWCGPCIQMDRQVFSKETVQKELADWVVVKIDTDQFPKIAKSFSVSGLPTFILIEKGQAILDSKEGFQTAESFISWLKKSKEKFQ